MQHMLRTRVRQMLLASRLNLDRRVLATVHMSD